MPQLGATTLIGGSVTATRDVMVHVRKDAAVWARHRGRYDCLAGGATVIRPPCATVSWQMLLFGGDTTAFSAV